MQVTERIKIINQTIFINILTNLTMAIVKIIVGFLGKSQALIADGVHSFGDLVTDGLVFFAAKAGVKAPDKDHPYGHQRIETLATIVIAIVLTSVAIGIGHETVMRILNHVPFVKPDYSTLVVAIAAIFANEFLFHYNMNRGNKIDSGVLRSNAWHSRSDALVSIIVVISVVGSLLGARYLDAIGALVIALLILKMAIEMIWTSIKELIDTGVEETLIEEISNHALKIDGVVDVHQLRTRSHGKNILLDMHIQVAPKITVSEGHYISEQVGIQLRQTFPKIQDVTVHIDPENDEEPTIEHLPNRPAIENLLKERWQSINDSKQIKKIILHYLSGKVSVDIYLPLSALSKQNAEQLNHYYHNAIKDIDFIDHCTIYFLE